MNRRAFLFASLAVPAVGTARAASGLQVIYVGGLDCLPCKRWRATYKDQWLASPEYRQVVWYEIEPPHLKEAYLEQHWPDELWSVLDQVPRRSGTPRFLIVRDGRIVSNELGVSRWLNTLAELGRLLGE
ncbi:MAG TPA: hypothetical protein VEC60_18100 [Reyranella sp.]|nr:hypothetical protein [Reyranella sp.]